MKTWEYANDSCLTDCNDKYFNIVPIENDGAIFIGAFDDISGTQMRIKRIDGSGVLLWQQYWITPFISVQPIKSILDNNGNLIVGFSAVTNTTEAEDFAIAKFDTSSGFLDWHLELPEAGTSGNELSEIISSIAIDANNNIYGVGTGSNASAGITKNYLFRVDDSGNLDYRVECSYSGWNSSIHSLAADNSGNIYTLGTELSETKIEKHRAQNGSLIWSENISRDTAAISNVGFTLSSNAVFVANNFKYFTPDTSFSGGYWSNQHYMLTRLDTSGGFQWRRDYFTDTDSLAPQNGFGGAVQFDVCNNDLYFLSAQHLDSINNILILHRVDNAGNTVWYDTASIELSAGIFGFDDQCDVYTARTFDNYNLTEKYTTTPVSAVETLTAEKSFDLFPNPTQGEFSVRFNHTKNTSGEIFIYNSLGGMIKRESISGSNFKISLSGFHSGIYLVQLVAEGSSTSTQVLIKN